MKSVTMEDTASEWFDCSSLLDFMQERRGLFYFYFIWQRKLHLTHAIFFGFFCQKNYKYKAPVPVPRKPMSANGFSYHTPQQASNVCWWNAQHLHGTLTELLHSNKVFFVVLNLFLTFCCRMTSVTQEKISRVPETCTTSKKMTWSPANRYF